MHAYFAERFKNKIIEDINTSELSLPTAYYILKEVFADLEKTYYEQSKEEPKIEEQSIEMPFTEGLNGDDLK